jgi:hypothetical protein
MEIITTSEIVAEAEVTQVVNMTWWNGGEFSVYKIYDDLEHVMTRPVLRK